MEVQDRYECLHFYYAVIDIAVVLGHTAMEKIFLYGLTLCRRICPTSITSSRLRLWASRFPSVFSWAPQFTAAQWQGRRKYIQKEGSAVQLLFVVMTSISWVLFMTRFDCHSFYGFIEIYMLQLMQEVYPIKQCQGLATEIILSLWQSPWGMQIWR